MVDNDDFDYEGNSIEYADLSYMGRNIRRRDIRKIFNYLKNIKANVQIDDEYNNSMCDHKVRTYKGIIQNVTIGPAIHYGSEFKVEVTFDDGRVAEMWLDSDYKFLNRNYNPKYLVLGYINSGPYCYFSVKVLDKEEEIC